MQREPAHEVLGIPVDSDKTTVKAAFRKLAMQCHPDRQALSPWVCNSELLFRTQWSSSDSVLLQGFKRGGSKTVSAHFKGSRPAVTQGECSWGRPLQQRCSCQDGHDLPLVVSRAEGMTLRQPRRQPLQGSSGDKISVTMNPAGPCWSGEASPDATAADAHISNIVPHCMQADSPPFYFLLSLFSGRLCTICRSPACTSRSLHLQVS